jgi:hypothetical protein
MSPTYAEKLLVPVVLTIDGHEYHPINNHVKLTQASPQHPYFLEFQLTEELPVTDPPSFVPVSVTVDGVERLRPCEARVCPLYWQGGSGDRAANTYQVLIRLVP